DRSRRRLARSAASDGRRPSGVRTVKLAAHQLEDRSFEREDVELTLRVLSEGGDLRQLRVGIEDLLPVPLILGPTVLEPKAAKEGRAVVRVEVDPVELRQRVASIDIAAGDRAADLV